MSFINQETSLDGASPQELYTISYDFNKWRYTSGDEDFIEDATVYKATPISRSDIDLKSDKIVSTFEVEVPLDSPYLELYRITPPSGRVTLLVQRFHRTDQALEKHVIFKGSIVNVNWEVGFAKLTCETASSTLSRTGLRRHYQYGCPHMLYGNACGVDRNNHSQLYTATSVAGNTVEVADLVGSDSGIYVGGFVQYEHGALSTPERISIQKLDASTGTLTLFMVPVGLLPGGELTVYEGCNRSLPVCKSRFNNVHNFGGQPYMPDVSPFGSNTVF